MRRFLVYFVLIALILGFLTGSVVQNMIRNQRADKRYLMQSKANIMEDQMQLLIARVHNMRFILIAQQGQPERFDQLAAMVLKGWDESSENFVHNIALAPGGVIENVYPLAGNEPLVGYNLWEAAAPNPDAVETMRRGEVYITPPIDLMQGGRGMNICLPVTLPGADSPWGMTAIVVDTDKLVQSFGLTDLVSHGMEYCLEYMDMDGNYIPLVSSGKVEQPLTHEFRTENLQWRMSVTGTLDKVTLWSTVLLLTGAFLVSLLLSINLAGQSMKKQVSEMFRELANTDSVTGCATRHFVYENLVNQETGKWNYDDMNYSVVLLDVDHFKQVNDTYGHDVGDQLLAKIAAMLRNALVKDKGDCAIRFGGDEFVLLFGNRTQQQLRDVMMHILTSMRTITLPEAEGLELAVSIGGVHPDQMEEEATYFNMLRVADDKLYRAKQGGRNRLIL